MKQKRTLEHTLTEFHSEIEISVAPRTMEFYQYLAKVFLGAARLLGIISMDIKNVRKAHILKIIKTLKNKKLYPYISAGTIAKIFPHISRFFDWCCDEKYIKANPAQELDIYRPKSVAIQPFTPEECLALISRQPHNPIEERDFAIWHLELDTGSRCHEVCGIKLNDYDGSSIMLREAKRGGTRKLKISRITASLIDKYIQRARVPRSSYLFTTRGGDQMTPRALSKQLTKHAKKVGVRNASMHRFRARFATHYYQVTRDLLGLQALLGHRSPDMSQRYVHLANQELANENNLKQSLVDEIYSALATDIPSTPAPTHPAVQENHNSLADDELVTLMKSMIEMMQELLQHQQNRKPSQS